jgi:hypothetical protein
MSIKILFFSFLLGAILFFMPSITFARSVISGQVVDAETGMPIEKVAIYIYWGKYGFGPPGLDGGNAQVEVAEDLTNEKGFFKIPKYSTLLKHYSMAVYKKGYVCWSSDKIFPTWEDRKDFKLKNKMVIKLEKFKEEYSKEDHARFTIFSQVGTGLSGVFDGAIEPEIDLFYGINKRSRGK